MGALSSESFAADSTAQQREFLDRYIFRELGARRAVFDVETIPHFTPAAFLQVLERCERFGVHVYGVELFTCSGEPIHLQLSRDGAPYSLLPAVVPFCRFENVTVCATFGVPGALLSAVSQELIDAYATSEYHVYAQGTIIDIRVGERNVQLEQLLRERSIDEAYLITACSPFSRGRRPSDHPETAALRLDLESVCVTILSAAAAGGTPWEESGFLALGCAEDHIRQFGDEYGQNAVLAVRATGHVELMLLR